MKVKLNISIVFDLDHIKCLFEHNAVYRLKDFLQVDVWMEKLR